MPASTIIRRHGWLLGVGAVALLLHLPYLVPGGPSSRDDKAWALMQDEGTVVYDAYRVVLGEIPYRDFFEFQGPVFYWTYAAVLGVTGPSMAAARLLSLLTTVAACVFLALLVASFAGRVAGAGAAAVHAGLLVPFWPFAYPQWLAAALALGGLALLVAGPEAQPSPPRQWAAGVVLALSAATIQSVGGPALVAALGTAALPGLAARDLRRAAAPVGRLLAAAVGVLGVIAIYFAAHGALGDLVYAVFRWPVENYGHGQGELAYAAYTSSWLKAHAAIPQPWRAAGVAGLHLARALPFVAAVAAPFAALESVRRLRRREPDHRHALVAGAALAALSPLLLGMTRQDLTHVAFLACFGLCAAAACAGAWGPAAGGVRPAGDRAPAGPAARRTRLVAGALFAAAGAVALAGYGSKLALSWSASRGKADWAGEVAKLPGGAWLATLPPDARIAILGRWAGWRYLYVRRAAVSYTLVPLKAPRYFAEAQWQRLADEIADRRPAALLIEGEMWLELLRRRGDIAALYEAVGAGRYLLAASSPAPPPAPPPVPRPLPSRAPPVAPSPAPPPAR